MGLVFRTALVAVLMFACVAPAAVYAQQAPSELEVRVKDANGRPLPNARVYVNGPLTDAVLTPDDGVVRFTDVDPGIYTLRIVLAG
jgi:protocatechuate 3,4-dioxygenase beta subunit